MGGVGLKDVGWEVEVWCCLLPPFRLPLYCPSPGVLAPYSLSFTPHFLASFPAAHPFHTPIISLLLAVQALLMACLPFLLLTSLPLS